ncbi:MULTISPECIES: hypothetical protein [unclassified Sphingobacterium]|uniref:hypothetical protein n=1 Tax=unclassified Sphingobacterium TaxID=2609468 RepID=UPI0025CF717E|nr:MULTISPECIES: hypothetical protein [unclassified Sphingobacterium]
MKCIYIRLDYKTLQQYYSEVGEYGRKLYLKNEAIRAGNWDLYETTLKKEFPADGD